MTVPRTDLALEAADDLAARTKKNSPPEGIRRLESLQEGYAVTDIRITNDAGAQALGRPVGRYITVDLRPYFDRQRTFFHRAVWCIAQQLRALLPDAGPRSQILVAGLGNRAMTPDAIGPTAVEMDVVQPYKASTWDSIPDWAKDPDGKWCISYVGTMSAMVNADRVSTTIDSWQALKDSGATITIGDVVRGASAQMAVLSCAYALGGSMDNLDPAFDFFKEMAQEGRLDAGTYSQERMDRAEIDVLLTWDYLTLQYRDLTKASVPDANIECHVMKDGALQSGYALVINKYAPHPYAAAATVEYLLSDEGQINRAEGYARPIRSDVELPAELSAKMIPDEEYTNTIPLTDNDAVTAACTEIATRWEEEIIPLMG